MLINCSYLWCCCVQSWSHRNLILCSWSYMKSSLSYDWHVQMVNNCNFETLRAFIIVAVVVGLDVEQYTESIILASFCTFFWNKSELINTCKQLCTSLANGKSIFYFGKSRWGDLNIKNLRPTRYQLIIWGRCGFIYNIKAAQ